MSESAIQPETDYQQDHYQSQAYTKEQYPRGDHKADTNAGSATQGAVPNEKIIWTPGFLVIFALTLVLGLSAASLFTQGWYTHLYKGQGIILAEVVLAALGWLGLGVVTRSRWIRVGSIFGGIGSLFMLVNIVLNLQGLTHDTPLQSYINVATCMALLGASIGLSARGTLLNAWDTWLFLLAPILGAAGVALTYYLTPQASIITVEDALSTAVLIFSCLVWWFRPSCWKKQPGPTFLFGLVPAILLAMAPINMSMHTFFLLQITELHVFVEGNANNFFFTQITQLSLLLGCMRLIQSEIVK